VKTLSSPLAGPMGRAEAHRLAYVLKALADPVRLQILGLLADGGQMYGKQFESRIPLAQPTIAHHLTVLRVAGLLSREKAGSLVWYRVNRAALAEVGATLGGGDGRA
jgi:ArsR family transcriptional regulator